MVQVKRIVRIASLLLFFGLTPAVLAAAENTTKPNIVLVVMDNFGYGEPGVYGGGAMRGAPTPNMDSIAHEGLRLTNFNVEAECTPSRAALMTGRYGIRTRLRKDAPPRSIWYGLTQWEITLAEVLSDLGYATGIFGKWHLGDTPGRYPTDQGFDEWVGIPNSSDEAHWPDTLDQNLHSDIEFTHVLSAKRGEEPRKLAVYDPAKRREIDQELTDHAVAFIKRQQRTGKPFFAYIPYTQTHFPAEPHPDYHGKTGNGQFADVLAQIDAYVGKLLTTIAELGIEEDTLVIFTADNGREGLPGSWGFTGPWRGEMFTPYEGSLRVPFLARWPGKIPKQLVSNDIVHLVDVFPTIASVTGAELPTDRVIDGVDQSEFLLGRSKTSNRVSMVFYVRNELFGAKWRDWKMLLNEMDENYVVRKKTTASFYNLLMDPKEEEPALNVLDHTWVISPLGQVIERHLKSIAEDAGAPGP